VTVTWRRLFTPRPSPALEQMLGWLATTPYAWYLNPDGKLRTREHGAEMCPVTGVVRHRTRARYGVGDWVRAAERIGLSYADACLVVQAADVCQPPTARMRRLRQRLLVATGIAPPRAGRPEGDPMDRALASLLASHTERPGAPVGPRAPDGNRVPISVP
jgi:hypothetical protein